MSNINGYTFDIAAKRAYTADANHVVIYPSGVGPTGPQYTVLIGQKVPGTPGTPAIPAQPQIGEPGMPTYQPATAGSPGTQAVSDAFFCQRQESLVLNQAEWDNWDKSMTDEAYIRSIAAARFGLTLA